MSDHSRAHDVARSPRTLVTIAIVLAAASGLTAGIALGQRPGTHAVAAVAPSPVNAQGGEPEHDPSLPSPAEVFEHRPSASDAEPSTF